MKKIIENIHNFICKLLGLGCSEEEAQENEDKYGIY